MAKLFRRVEKRDLSVSPELLRPSLFATHTPTGISVTPDVAMTVTAFFSAIRFRAFAVASLPKILYQRTGQGKRRVTESQLYGLLHDIPNKEMTAFDLWSMLDSHVMIRGNAYAEIVSDNAGNVVEIWPLRPDKMSVVRNEAGALRYIYQLPQKFDNKKVELLPEQVLHLRGLTTDGVMGYAPITMMRNAVGLTKATEDYAAAYFGNGAQPGMVLKHPAKLKDPDRLRDQWEHAHQGLDQAHRVAVLEEGMSVEKIGLSPEDSQFLETRVHQVYEISRMTDVPPQMIFELSQANFSTLEQMTLDFVVHHLRPWLVAYEQQCNRSLLLESERNAGWFVENLIDGLLRGDLQTRYNAYAIGKQNGWLTTNKILQMENMNTIGPKGDVYTVPLNMSVLGEDGMPKAVPDASPAEPNTPARSMVFPTRAMVYPILKDAAERIGKRELNEFTNARKKFGNNARFAAWAEQFYKQDYPAFIRTVMMPLVQSGFVNDGNLQLFDGYCASRGELALTDAMGVYVVDEIVSLFEEKSDE